MIITYSECVSVVLVILHVKRLLGIILPSVACPILPYLPRFTHKRHNFRGEKRFLNIKCVFDFLYNVSL